MSKRILFLALLVLCLPVLCFAAPGVTLRSGDSGVELGTTANTIKVNIGSNTADGTTANPLITDNVSTHRYKTALGSQSALLTGANTIYSIIMTSDSAADTLVFYDSLLYTPVLVTQMFIEVEVGVANSTATIPIPGGVNITTGLSVVSSDSSVVYTIIYD